MEKLVSNEKSTEAKPAMQPGEPAKVSATSLSYSSDSKPEVTATETSSHGNDVCLYDEYNGYDNCLTTKDSYTTIAFPQTLSDTRIDAVSQPLSLFVGQSDGHLESVRVQSDTETSGQRKDKLVQKTRHQPRNGHSVKRQQKCSKVERDVTNFYRRLSIFLYIVGFLGVAGTITFWVLSYTSVFTTDRDVLAWSFTIATICLMVIAIFSDVKSRRHRREMKAMHKESRYGNYGQQNRNIYIGPHPATLGAQKLKKGSK